MKSSKSYSKFVLKNTFISKLFDRKVKKYLQEVVTNLKIRICFSGLGSTGSRSSIILLLMKGTLEFSMRKTNELINYRNSRSSKSTTDSIVTLPSMIK